MDSIELVESWINGNRSTVAEELAKRSPSAVIDFCEKFIEMVKDHEHELAVLYRAVRRVEEK